MLVKKGMMTTLVGNGFKPFPTFMPKDNLASYGHKGLHYHYFSKR